MILPIMLPIDFKIDVCWEGLVDDITSFFKVNSLGSTYKVFCVVESAMMLFETISHHDKLPTDATLLHSRALHKVILFKYSFVYGD